MVKDREDLHVIHNTAQPEVVGGLTLLPVRPVVRHSIAAEFTGYTPTPDTSFVFASQVGQLWPDLKGELEAILARHSAQGITFVPSDDHYGGAHSTEQFVVKRWDNGRVELALPPVRFTREGGKIYEAHEHTSSVVLEQKGFHHDAGLKISSNIHAAPSSRVASAHTYEPIAFTDVPTVVPYYQGVASEVATWLSSRVHEVVAHNKLPFSLKNQDHAVQITALGVHDDALKNILMRIKEINEFAGEDITSILRNEDDLARLLAYFGQATDREVVRQCFTENQKNRPQDVAVMSFDAHTKEDGYSTVYEAPFIGRFDGDTLKYTGLVLEESLEEGGAAIRSSWEMGLNVF